MILSLKEITSFKELYRRKYKKTISDEQAIEMGLNLVNLLKVLITPSGEEIPPEIKLTDK